MKIIDICLSILMRYCLGMVWLIVIRWGVSIDISKNIIWGIFVFGGLILLTEMVFSWRRLF